MKLLPDASQCHATRMVNGARYVIEQAEIDIFWVVSCLPGVEIPRWYHRFVRLTVLAGVAVIGFALPPSMFVFVTYGLWASWMNGECHHCDALNREGNHDKSDQVT